MKTAKQTVLITTIVLILLSLSGCMVFSCEDCSAPRPRRKRHPAWSSCPTEPDVPSSQGLVSSVESSLLRVREGALPAGKSDGMGLDVIAVDREIDSEVQVWTARIAGVTG